MKTAACHRHRAKAVALTQHNCYEWHGDTRCGHKQASKVAHLSCVFGVWSDHEAWRVAQADNGNVIGIAQLNES